MRSFCMGMSGFPAQLHSISKLKVQLWSKIISNMSVWTNDRTFRNVRKVLGVKPLDTWMAWIEVVGN